ncbi:hypothetical protein [Paracoccus tegillarcae]|uniref:Uncharacterized protein n=1 Tax=Paracoccus tegillarcae TaxID=1529068 RepID=A0A2K9EF99_9RHOB|nr:hypothetical protein [Paracoccus tegillarcae]AUH33628.1 hypothetical protein CUV01_09720 [Paracoccus tegillarcae]
MNALKPRRLLVIGNSHAAAPRMAYAASPESWPDYDVAFLAVRGGNINQLELRGTVLHPMDAKTAREMQDFSFVREVDLTTYDALAIVGGFGWVPLAQLFDGHRCMGFPSVLAGDDDCQLIGRSLMRKTLEIRTERIFSTRLMRKLKPMGKPIVMMPEPLPSDECGADLKTYEDYSMMVARGDAGHARRMFQRAARHALRNDAILPFWPDSVIVDDAYTSAAFMRGAPRLSPGFDVMHGSTDFAHGNADYGALLLDRIIGALPQG